MIWVVGTGRCGMHNYTALQGGWIQSAKDWKGLAVKRFHGELTHEEVEHINGVIRMRMALPYPCVSDCAQFIFIDIIRHVDPSATFVWLQAEKERCVEEFMAKSGEEFRIHPKGWHFHEENKKRLLEWYYETVNHIIRHELEGASFKKIRTEDLPRATPESIERLRAFA